jgi:hypothetical protein
MIIDWSRFCLKRDTDGRGSIKGEKSGGGMKILKKLAQISSAAVRLTIGIGGAVLIFLALKDDTKRRTSRKPNLKA